MERNVLRTILEGLEKVTTLLEWSSNILCDVETSCFKIRGGFNELVRVFVTISCPGKHKASPWFGCQLLRVLHHRNSAWRLYQDSEVGCKRYGITKNRCTSMELTKKRMCGGKLTQDVVTAPKRFCAYLRWRIRVKSVVLALGWYGSVG